MTQFEKVFWYAVGTLAAATAIASMLLGVSRAVELAAGPCEAALWAMWRIVMGV